MNLFIVGVGRSGTSLLHSMFAAHKSITAYPETAFLRRYILSDADYKALAPDNMVMRKQEYVEILKHPRKEWLNLYLAELSKNNNALEKDPRLIEYVDLINYKIPDSKIIHIYRDPRDVLLSKKKAEWSKGRMLISYLIAGAAQLRLIRRNENLAIHVKYEDLIANPEKELKNICKKLGLEFDVSMLDHRASAKKLTHDDEKSWKSETLSPVKSNNYNKWKGQLTGFEVAAIYYSNKWIYKYGCYNNELKDVSILDHLIGYITGKVASVMAVTYCVIRIIKNIKLL